MAEINQEAALHTALGMIGAEMWSKPSTVLVRAQLSAAQQMVRQLAGPDGRVCILADGENGCRRHYVEPDVDDFAGEMHMAMTAAGYRGAEVAVNDVAPGGSGLPVGAEVLQLRGVPVTFSMRPGEAQSDLFSRAFGPRFDDFLKREKLCPLSIRDTIGDRYCEVFETEAPVPLRDSAERDRAAAVVRVIAAYLGGDVIADPLPGIVPLAGSEMVNVAGTAVGSVVAYRLPHSGIARKLPSSLEALEQFVALLEIRNNDNTH